MVIKEGSTADKIMTNVGKAFDFIYGVFLEYAKVVLLVIVFIVSAQVFSRNVLKKSISWSEEVALLLMVWTAFISMAIGVERKIHVSITIFFDMLPKPISKVLGIVNYLIVILFGFVMIFYGSKLIGSTWNSTMPATKLPAGTLYLMVPLSGMFITYYTILQLFGLEKYHKTPRGVEEE